MDLNLLLKWIIAFWRRDLLRLVPKETKELKRIDLIKLKGERQKYGL